MAKFVIVNHSAYGRAMDHALRAFVDRRELTNTNFHDRNGYKPKTLLENPSTHALYSKNNFDFAE